MGLLNRARLFETNSQLTEKTHLVAKAESIVGSIEHRPHYLDYPVEIFDAFTSLLNISRGSLMFYDQYRQIYTPWMSKGLDVSTLRHVRFSKKLSYIPETGHAGILNKQDLKFLVSNREFDLLNQPYIISLGESDDPTAILLVLQGNSISNNSDAEKAIRILNTSLMEGIDRSRQKVAIRISVQIMFTKTWLSDLEDIDADIIIIDLQNTVKKIINANRKLEYFSLQRDLSALIRYICGQKGRIHDDGHGILIIFLPRIGVRNGRSFYQQLNRTLRSSYKSIEDKTELGVSFYSWPEDKNLIDEVTAEKN